MLRRPTSIVGKLWKNVATTRSVLSTPLPRLFGASGSMIRATFSTSADGEFKDTDKNFGNSSAAASTAEVDAELEELLSGLDEETKIAVRDFLATSADLEDDVDEEADEEDDYIKEPEFLVQSEVEKSVPSLKVPFVPDALRIQIYVLHILKPEENTAERLAEFYGISIDRIKAIIVLMHKRYEMMREKGYEIVVHPGEGSISVVIPEPWVLLYGKYLEDPTRDIAETLKLYNEQVNNMKEEDFVPEELTPAEIERYQRMDASMVDDEFEVDESGGLIDENEYFDDDLDFDKEDDGEDGDEEEAAVNKSREAEDPETTTEITAEPASASDPSANVEIRYERVRRTLSSDDRLVLESLSLDTSKYEREDPKPLTKAEFKLDITPEEAKIIIDNIIDHERRIENLQVMEEVMLEDFAEYEEEHGVKIEYAETANDTVLNGKKPIEETYFPQLLSDENFDDFKAKLLDRLSKETQAEVRKDVDHYHEKFKATAGQKLGKSTSPEAASRWKLAFRDNSTNDHKSSPTVVRSRQGELRTATPLEEQIRSWHHQPTFLDEEFIKVTEYNNQRVFGTYGDFDKDNHLTEELRLKKLEKTKAQKSKGKK